MTDFSAETNKLRDNGITYLNRLNKNHKWQFYIQ